MPNPELQHLIEGFRRRPFDPGIEIADLRKGLDRLAGHYAPPAEAHIERVTIAGLSAEKIVAGAGPRVLFLHGGGYVTGSPTSHRHLAARLAADLGGTVFVLDYRLAPEAPFPSAAQDCLAAYAELADAPLSIVGDSAGGGLAFSTAVAARERRLPQPKALVALSPWVNLGCEHECYRLLAAADPVLSQKSVAWYAAHYLAGAAATDPVASPLFADLTGLPPTLIQIGDREVFFGDAVRMQIALISAGVDAELSVWKDMFHVWQIYWPVLRQGRDAIAAVASFIARCHRGDAPLS